MSELLKEGWLGSVHIKIQSRSLIYSSSAIGTRYSATGFESRMPVFLRVLACIL